MIELANRLLGRQDPGTDLQNQFMNQQISTESAKANLSNAELERQIAEIAVLEYEEGISVQERATAEGELKLAESDLTRAQDSIVIAKDQLARIKRASKGSSADLANEFAFADTLENAERRLPKSELAVSHAKFKVKALVEYTRPKRIKELRSAVARARSKELAKRAALELEQRKQNRLEEAIKRGSPAPRKSTAPESADRRAMATLDRAISVEEKLRAKLDQVAKSANAGNSLRKEIDGLIRQLRDLVDQAEAERSLSELDELKERIHKAAR
jgi:hypothetical protein